MGCYRRLNIWRMRLFGPTPRTPKSSTAGRAAGLAEAGGRVRGRVRLVSGAADARGARIEAVGLLALAWCQGGELNSRPRAYESPALPLSYPGKNRDCERGEN
jgi:hypothetical protein